MRSAVRAPVRVAFVILALLVAARGVALAHGGGAIRLASNQVAVGGSVGMTGEKLPKSTALRLELRGTLENYPAGQVRTDTAGAFTSSLTLPPNVPVGMYTLVAIAPDSDVAGRADLSVVAASGAAGMAGMQMPGMQMGGMSQMMGGGHATAEKMALDRRTTGIEWAVIAVVILVSVAGGLALLGRARALAAQDDGAQGAPLGA